MSLSGRRSKPFFRSQIKFNEGTRSCMMLDGMKIDDIDEIDVLFTKLQQKIDVIYETEKQNPNPNEDTTVYRSKEMLMNSLSDDEIKNTFSIDLYSNGHVEANLINNETCIKIDNHVGNINSISRLCDLWESDIDSQYYQTIRVNKYIRAVSSKSVSNLSKIKTPNIYESGAFEEMLDNSKVLRNYMNFIQFCFDSLGKQDRRRAHEENEFFEIYRSEPVKVRLRNRVKVYSVQSVLTRYFQYIKKMVSKRSNYQMEYVVVSVPKTYGITQYLDIKYIIENAGLKLRVFITDNVLDTLFYRIQSKIDEHVTNEKMIGDIAKLNSTFQLNDSIHNDVRLDIGIESNGYSFIEVTKNGFNHKISNQIGNFKELEYMQNKVSKSEKLIIKEYLNLMKFAFKYLDMSETITESIESEYFELKLERNDNFVFSKTTNEKYTLQDILIKYFETISSVIVWNCGYKPQFVHMISQLSYEVNQEYELKKCIEKAFMRSIRILPETKLNDLFYFIQENFESINYANLTNTFMPLPNDVTALIEDKPSDSVLISVQEQGNLLIEMRDKRIRGHIGDFHGQIQTLNRKKKDPKKLEKSESSAPSKILDHYVIFINTCFQLIFNKNYVYNDIFENFIVTYDINMNPTIKFKDSTEEYLVIDIVERYFKLVWRHVKKVINSETPKPNLYIIAPRYFTVTDLFQLKDLIERNYVNVGKLLSKDPLCNLFMKVHFNINKQTELKKDKIQEYNGPINASYLDQKSFGIEFDKTGRVNVVISDKNKAYLLVDHVGCMNPKSLINTNTKDGKLLEEFFKLLEISMDSIRGKFEENAVNESGSFKVSGTFPATITFTNSQISYTTEDFFTNYFRCLHRSIWEITSRRTSQVIIAIPKDFRITEIFTLKTCIDRAQIKTFALVSKCPLNNLFFKVKSIFDDQTVVNPFEFGKSKNAKVSDILWMKVESDGRADVVVLDNKQVELEYIQNHIGDYYAFERNPETSARSWPVDETEIIENHKDLIELCMRSLMRFRNIKYRKFTFFEVKSSSDPVIIRFKDNPTEYKLTDILALYFEAILITAYHKTGKKPKMLVCSLPYELNIYENFQLQKCFQKAGITLIRAISNYSLKDMFFNMGCQLGNSNKNPIQQSQSNEKTEKPTKDSNSDTIKIRINLNGSAIVSFENENGKLIDKHIGDFEVLNEFSKTKEFEPKIQKVTNKQGVEIEKAKLKPKYIEDYKELLRVSFASLKVCQRVKENLIFKTLSEENKFLMKGSIEDFKPADAVTFYFQCLINSISTVANIKKCNFIFEFQREYDIYELFELKQCIENSAVNNFTICSNNRLNDFFLRMNVKLERIPESKAEKIQQLTKNGNQLTDETKTLIMQNRNACCFKLNESICVYTAQNDNIVEIQNHIANSRISSVILGDEPLLYKGVESNLKLTENMKLLFDICLKSMSLHYENEEVIDNDLFKVTGYNPTTVVFKDNPREYTATDILINFFECISRMIPAYNARYDRRLLMVTSPEISIYNQMEIKHCINQGGFEVIDIKSESSLNDFFNWIHNEVDQFIELKILKGYKPLEISEHSAELKNILKNDDEFLIEFDIHGNIFISLYVDELVKNQVLKLANHIGDSKTRQGYIELKQEYLTKKRRALANGLVESLLTFDAALDSENNSNDIILMNSFNKLIAYCFQRFSGQNEKFKKENDDAFEVYGAGSSRIIKMKDSNQEYKLVDVVTAYLECVCQFVRKYSGKKLRKVVCKLPKEFDILIQHEIKLAIQRANLSLVRIASMDELVNIFLRIENLFHEQSLNVSQYDYEKSEYFMSRSEITFNHDDLQDEVFVPLVQTKRSKTKKCRESVIEVRRNGTAVLAIMDKNEPIIINNHVGDFDALRAIENKENSTFIENYKQLIKYCFSVTDKSTSEILQQKINLFEIVLKDDEIKLVSKRSSIEYTPEDVLTNYFKCLATTVWKTRKAKITRVILSVPSEYKQKGVIKVCAERAKLNIVQMYTTSILKCIEISKKKTYAKDDAYVTLIDNDNVTLCEVEAKKSLNILVSVNSPTNAYRTFLKEFYDLLKSSIVKKTKRIIISEDSLKNLLLHCDHQFKEGKDEATVKISEDTGEIKVKKADLEKYAQVYIESMHSLVTKILQTCDISINKTHLYYTFPTFMKHILQKHLKDNSEPIYQPDNTNAILALTVLSDRIATPGFNEIVDSKLIENIGFRSYNGTFQTIFENGTYTPCKIRKSFRTMIDNQSEIKFEFYKSYKPSMKYGEFMCVVHIQNIPMTRICDLRIDVEFTLDNSNTLKAQAIAIEKGVAKELLTRVAATKSGFLIENSFHDAFLLD